MTIKKIVEVCKVRKDCEQDCKGCIYMGKTCTHAINVLKVKRPSDYELNKEEKQ